MSAWLVLAVGAVYLVVAVELLIKQQLGMGVTFAGYALANVGLYVAMKST